MPIAATHRQGSLFAFLPNEARCQRHQALNLLSDEVNFDLKRRDFLGRTFAVLVVLLLGGGVYYFMTAGRESTDDAQVDAHVTPIAALVGGTVAKVSVADNQQVDAGTELVVTQQNLAATSSEALAQKGRAVRLAWKRQHNYAVGRGGPSEEEES